MRRPITILRAIADVVERSSIYTVSRGTVEVERLYHVPSGLDGLVSALSGTSFEAKQELLQEDSFYDLASGEGWQLADTDHHIRIRVVRASGGAFLEGEIKVAYPAPLSNPNARFSPAETLTEEETNRWRAQLESLGFGLERQYRKKRVSFRSLRKYRGFEVELEADRFLDHECNGRLAGESFLAVSVETEGPHRIEAELAVLEAKAAIDAAGVVSSVCEGNYEDLFYAREQKTKTGMIDTRARSLGFSHREESLGKYISP